MSTKAIVTNISALKAKYGSGLSGIRQAITALIAADLARGVTTRLIELDNASAMAALQAPPVKSAAAPKQYKVAIDAVYKALVPDYLVLLGSVDVIPHQRLKNPLFSGDDPDRYAFSDLPYACEASYGTQINRFLGPTRVVGRIPDLSGGSDAGYLTKLLAVAANWKARDAAAYDTYLGISAQVWRKSTALSLKKLFGSSSAMRESPPKGPNWTATQYRHRAHFINCHGAQSDAFYYGEKDGDFPEAFHSAKASGKLLEGTVAAVECCYGAELYDPQDAGGETPICNTYLGGKAYGFFGSSTIAYGPAEGNGAADLICQHFLRRVFEGASVGRAALEARQEFVQQNPGLLDPVDQKTLAQFNLLGDPSVHPVGAVEDKAVLPVPPLAKAARKNFAMLAGRSDRRRQLLRKGLLIPSMVRVAVEAKLTRLAAEAQPKTASDAVRKALDGLSKKFKAETHLLFEIRGTAAPQAMAGLAAKMAPAREALHVLMADRTTDAVKKAFAMSQRPGRKAPKQLTVVVAKEEDGKIVSYREFQSR